MTLASAPAASAIDRIESWVRIRPSSAPRVGTRRIRTRRIGARRILAQRGRAQGRVGFLAEARDDAGERFDVGERGAEIDDAGAQDEAPADDRVRHERLAALLDPFEERLVELVEIL